MYLKINLPTTKVSYGRGARTVAERGSMSTDILTNTKNMIVLLEADEYAQQARLLADRLRIKLTESPAEAAAAEVVLRFTADGLVLEGQGQTLRDDLAHMLPRLKQSNLQGELLVRAVKIKAVKDRPLNVVDATAGFGEDSLLLAAAGHSVRLYERNPIIAALLRDALHKAQSDPRLAHIVARMQLFEADSICALKELPQPPDVVLLDPMFPEKSGFSLNKKKFQLLHCLEQPCADEIALMQAAFDARPQKIVVKRPLRSPCLADVKPAYSLTGKTIRYDCIVVRSSTENV